MTHRSQCVIARPRKAFSLLEVLLAVTIAATGLSTLVVLTGQSARQDVAGEAAGLLETALLSQLDVQCHRPWDELERAARSTDRVLAWKAPGLPASLGTLVVDARARALLVEEDLVRVEVEVRWRLQGARTDPVRTLTFARLVDRTDSGLGGDLAPWTW